MAFEHFVLLVAGENPEEKFAQYNAAAEIEPYVLYKKSDAGEMRKHAMEYFKNSAEQCDEEIKKIIDNLDLSEAKTDEEKERLVEQNTIGINKMKAFFEARLEELENFDDDEDFFNSLAEGKEVDAEGNIIGRHNPDGKFSTIRVAGVFANPFRLHDGTEVYSAKKGDINWDAIHLALPAVNTYTRLWDMCVDGDEPKNDIEKEMWLNMKERKDYFLNFENKDEFVASNTAFWAFAFIDPDGKYVDFEESGQKQFDWMTSFYEKFIEPLSDDTLLTLYECGRQ